MGSRLIWKSQPRLYVRIFHLSVVFFHSALNHSRQLLEHLPLILIIRIPAQSPNPGPDLMFDKHLDDPVHKSGLCYIQMY